MTVLPSPEAMIVICTVILIAYTAHVLDKAFASSEQYEALLSARDRIIGLQVENAKLRELVSILAYCMQNGSDCDGCRMNDAGGELRIDECFACDGLRKRLGEAGIADA